MDVLACTIMNMPESTRNSLLTLITDKLKDVCVRGSDIYHFLGSASEVPGDPRQYDDFEQVITTIFGLNNIPITNLCHPYLIQYPKKYDQQAPPSDADVVITKDTCVCNKLNEVAIKKQNDNFIGTTAQYIAYRYGVIVSQGMIETLTNGCNGMPDCKTYNPSLRIPAFFTCYGTAKETCISCEEYSDKVNSFRIKFPDLGLTPFEEPADEIQTNANLIFEQYMNYHTGFRKSWVDYIQFGKACNNYQGSFNCSYLDSLVTVFKLQYSDTLTGENCRQLFVQFFNQNTGSFYTWQQIAEIFMQSCGHLPDLCNTKITCSQFNQVISSFVNARDSHVVAVSINNRK